MSKYLPWKAEFAKNSKAKAKAQKAQQYKRSDKEIIAAKAADCFQLIFNWDRENRLMDWARRPTDIAEMPNDFKETRIVFKTYQEAKEIRDILYQWRHDEEETDLLINTKPFYSNKNEILDLCLEIIASDILKFESAARVDLELAVLSCLHIVNEGWNATNNNSIDASELEALRLKLTSMKKAIEVINDL